MKVALVSMPFYNPRFSPYNLLKLKAFCEAQNPGAHTIDIINLNNDFVRYFGLKHYNQISLTSVASGMGEWLFKPVAFPEAADDSEAFRNLFTRVSGPGSENVFNEILQKRAGVAAFLEEAMSKHGLLHNFDLTGFTSIFAQNNASFAACRLIKNFNPQIRTCLGGPHCASPMGEEIIKNVPWVDVVFSGTALLSFGEYLAALQKNAPSDQIPGVIQRSNIASPSRIPYDDRIDEAVETKIDYQPFLDEFGRTYPNKEIEPMLMFATSTGCSWGEKSRCAFCGLNAEREKYRTMPQETMKHVLEHCLSYYPQVKEFHAVDNLIPKEIVALDSPAKPLPPDVVIRYETRTDLSKDDLTKISARGVRWIQPGIESLCTKELQLMHKGTSAFQNLAFLKRCLSLDIFPSWNILLGMPGMEPEKYDFYFELLPKLFHLIPPVGVFPIRADRFSPLFERYEREKSQIQPLPYYSHCYPFSDDSLRNFAYHFACPESAKIYPMLGRLRGVIMQWKALWQRSEPPKLVRQSTFNGESIIDSRLGPQKRHLLTPIVAQVLNLLEKQQSRESILKQIPTIAPHQLDSLLRSLTDAGFLFREGELYISLVLPSDPGNSPFIRKNI